MTRNLWFSLAVLSSLILGTSAAAPAEARSPADVGPQRELSRVSVDSPSDAWAIGRVDDAKSIVRHWNGSAWLPVPIQVPEGVVELRGVEALAPNDVWIVGKLSQGDGTFATLAEHWDGTAFSVVPSPNPDQASWFSGVSGVSSDDVWAVGGTEAPVSLTEHWDGTSWSVVQSPGGNDSDLAGVVAIASDDVWASGFYFDHWDGHRWTVVKDQTSYGFLDHLSAESPSDVWASGYANDRGEPFVQRWNGTGWKDARVGCRPFGVYPVARDNVWVATTCGSGTKADAGMFRWDGKRWHRVTVPARGLFSSLKAIDGSGPDDIWAVGGYRVNSDGSTVGRPLYEHWDGSTWTVVRR